jgi:hypothetical protein
VHIRRALLLFAIVLGLAAIAASVSRSPEDSSESQSQPVAPADVEETPSVTPGTAPVSGVRELVFEADREQTRRLDTDRPATVFVEVDEPGLVEIPDLGLIAPAEPLTPARFEIPLRSEPARMDITFTAVEDDFPRPAGTLVVRESAEG